MRLLSSVELMRVCERKRKGEIVLQSGSDV